MRRGIWVAFLSSLFFASLSFGQESSGLQKNLKDIEVHGAWIYNDLEEGFAEAQKTGKPLLVVFR